MSNVSCKIFKEQIELLKSLPNQEEAKNVLYQAIMNAYNHFEYQNENQIENQNECAYISISLSLLSINILNLLSKNIVFKEYSSNYGGRREESGRPKKNQDEIHLGNQDAIQAVDKDKDIDKDKNKELINKLIKRNKLKVNQYIIDDQFRITDIPEIEVYEKEVGTDLVRKVQDWLVDKKYNQVVDKQFICKQIINFSKRQGLI